MTNSQLFKQAHKLAKTIILKGDCYRTTFGACVKFIKAKAKQAVAVVTGVLFAADGYTVKSSQDEYSAVVNGVNYVAMYHVIDSTDNSSIYASSLDDCIDFVKSITE